MNRKRLERLERAMRSPRRVEIWVQCSDRTHYERLAPDEGAVATAAELEARKRPGLWLWALDLAPERKN